jgi:hypothetical protein
MQWITAREAAGELFNLALLLPQGDEQGRAGFPSVFAAEPFGGVFLAADFVAGGVTLTVIV